MPRWLPLGLIAAALLIGGCGPSQAQGDDWKLVFQGDRNGEWGIFAVGFDGRDAVRISRITAPSFWPPLPSPDGKLLVLPELYGLTVMRTDGSEKRRLGDGDPAQAAWSPDSKRLAFVGPDGGISVIDADGRHLRQVTGTEGDGSPVWSPDGKQIAFIRDSESSLVVIDADGEGERELAGENVSQHHWSPDGKAISLVDWERGLLTVSVEDGRVLSRHDRLGGDSSFGALAWSPDGRQLAYTRHRTHASHIVVMNVDGTGATRITDKAESASDPLWSPDGDSIVYVRRDARGLGAELWEVRLEDRKRRQLTDLYPNGVNVLQAAWIRGPVTPVREAELTVLPQGDGAVLENPQPVSHIAASGSLLAAVPPERLFGTAWTLTPPLVLWDPLRGKAERLSLASCQAGTGVALTRERVGYTCLGGHAASVGSTVEALPHDGGRPANYFTGAYGDGVANDALAGRIAGDDDFLYFTERRFSGEVVERVLWRVGARGKTVIVTGTDAGEPAAADGGRVAVERDDGVVTLLHADGRVIGRTSPGGGAVSDPPTFDSFPPATVDLEGPDLVVLRDGFLRHYDARSLTPVRSWRVPADAKLGGLASGVTAYSTRDDVHVVRLRDGAETVIPVRSGHIDATDLTTAGLFYAVNTQSVRYDYVQIEKDARSRIVFVRWDALLERLR